MRTLLIATLATFVHVPCRRSRRARLGATTAAAAGGDIDSPEARRSSIHYRAWKKSPDRCYNGRASVRAGRMSRHPGPPIIATSDYRLANDRSHSLYAG
jgi:hypothetical protein